MTNRDKVIQRCQELGLRIESLNRDSVSISCPEGWKITNTDCGWWDRVPQPGIPVAGYYGDLLEDLAGGIEPKGNEQ